ncbi:MAG: hypothetical protein A2687_01355 [Candidatus Levybacteria bacterium RIFCSPHIGHO2_01_FULL_38_26]|nr:MAG: hypothetical protein A2687_01355 [Candidatus Levybacteria bacterium RIFCSPHIGHO2_01_FULL_38_26]
MIKKRLKLTNYPPLMEEIKKVLKTVSYGSVEIYVQDNKVTQMTVRNIVKTKYDLNEVEDALAKSGIDIKTIQIRQKHPQNRVLTKENQ